MPEPPEPVKTSGSWSESDRRPQLLEGQPETSNGSRCRLLQSPWALERKYASIHIDFDQVIIESIASMDTDGSELVETAFVIPVIIPLDDVGPWLALYDETSGTSPTAANSRVIARAVLAALQAAAEG